MRRYRPLRPQAVTRAHTRTLEVTRAPTRPQGRRGVQLNSARNIVVASCSRRNIKKIANRDTVFVRLLFCRVICLKERENKVANDFFPFSIVGSMPSSISTLKCERKLNKPKYNQL